MAAYSDEDGREMLEKVSLWQKNGLKRTLAEPRKPHFPARKPYFPPAINQATLPVKNGFSESPGKRTTGDKAVL